METCNHTNTNGYNIIFNENKFITEMQCPNKGLIGGKCNLKIPFSNVLVIVLVVFYGETILNFIPD